MKIVETELVREQLYENIIDEVLNMHLASKNKPISHKENVHLVLRYVFNKIMTRTADDDPVFVTTESKTAYTQIQEDFKYFKITSMTADHFYIFLETEFKKAKAYISRAIISDDKDVRIVKPYILYNGIRFDDICSLGEKYPDNKSYALALNIRYTYLELQTQGLANDYASLGYKPSDNIIEGFASAFNHYFDKYHSAFPDLETVFGSRGSFFDCKEFDSEVVICNPPFDNSVMIELINKVNQHLSNTRNLIFHLTFPAWTDAKYLMDLEKNPHTKSFEIVPKEKTRFIDHMKGKIISPCSIIKVTMAVSNDK